MLVTIMSSTRHPADLTQPCIQLETMAQLAEVRTDHLGSDGDKPRDTNHAQARSEQDDWTGTRDAAARRRAQTRLNTRAYRKNETTLPVFYSC
jgi:hypothetical protein